MLLRKRRDIRVMRRNMVTKRRIPTEQLTTLMTMAPPLWRAVKLTRQDFLDILSGGERGHGRVGR